MFKNILDAFKRNAPPQKSKGVENDEIIRAYNAARRSTPDYKEPNYILAKKVFDEFIDFHLKNINEINVVYLEYIPKSLLPYPKNYIKCAYYVLLENAEKRKDLKKIEAIRELGYSLFVYYPDYAKYREAIEKGEKGFVDKSLHDMDPSPRELFKKMYGAYEISEEGYKNSPSSVDSTDEELIHDFGVLPEIEKDC
jgi:hypothetical protein